jgi:predicted HD phosphohydrolase
VSPGHVAVHWLRSGVGVPHPAGPPVGSPGLAAVVGLLRRSGAAEEPNEDLPGLTILHHGLQCAARLRRTDPDDLELQVAGLLHDVGHLFAGGGEEHHGAVGAALVRPVFGDRIAALIAAHVPAKRYLVSADRTYWDRLSAGSRRTLSVQGEAMTPEESAAFVVLPYADAAVRLRRADEAAKDPGAEVPGLDAWLPTLALVTG